MGDVETDVLIVGGGPVGLACAILAASMGVRLHLVERRRSVSHYPKARALTARSLEIFRQMGIEQEIHAAMPPARTRHYALAAGLAAPEIRLVPFGLGSLDPRDDTPCIGSFCPQDRLEPVLAARLEREPTAQVWFGAELLDYAQDAKGVVARVVREGGEEVRIAAGALVAADGAQGRCASLAGLGASDRMMLDPAVTVIFRAPLAERIAPLDCVYLLLGEAGSGLGGMVSGQPLARDSQEWSVVMTRVADWGGTLTEANAPLWEDAIRRLTGLADLDVSISAVAEWRREARILDRMAAGRVALAGDCAHLMPPAGGLGLNTGLQDAHALAWRLAAIAGGSEVSLLEDYERERLPEVRRSVDAAVQNYRQGADIDAIWNHPQVGLSLGVRYAEGGIVAEPDAPQPSAYPHRDYTPSASPGGRAPHFWLDDKQERSALDLFGREFVVLLADDAKGLRDTVAHLKAAGAPIACYVPHADGWRELYGLDSGGVLIRPDGIVAWRSRDDDGAGLEEAFWQIVRNPRRQWEKP